MARRLGLVSTCALGCRAIAGSAKAVEEHLTSTWPRQWAHGGILVLPYGGEAVTEGTGSQHWHLRGGQGRAASSHTVASSAASTSRSEPAPCQVTAGRPVGLPAQWLRHFDRNTESNIGIPVPPVLLSLHRMVPWSSPKRPRDCRNVRWRWTSARDGCPLRPKPPGPQPRSTH